VGEGLLERQLYQSEPPRYEYVLTEKGRDFFGVLAAMSAWGDRWLAGQDGPPIVFRHESCGQDTRAEVVCAACGEPLRAPWSLPSGPTPAEPPRGPLCGTG